MDIIVPGGHRHVVLMKQLNAFNAGAVELSVRVPMTAMTVSHLLPVHVSEIYVVTMPAPQRRRLCSLVDLLDQVVVVVEQGLEDVIVNQRFLTVPQAFPSCSLLESIRNPP